MNRRTRINLFIITFIIVILGWTFFRWLNPDPVSWNENDFQHWLWSNRSFDLIAQIGLVFAGTLAIAALLPTKDHDV